MRFCVLLLTVASALACEYSIIFTILHGSFIRFYLAFHQLLLHSLIVSKQSQDF